MKRDRTGVEVPMLDLAAQRASIADELDAAIARALASDQFILGPDVAAFEEELAHYCGTAHAVGCASGSDALLLALMAVGIVPGDEVICPSYTFFATASAVVRLGARPVFVDIAPETFDLCPDDLQRAVAETSRLRAILPVHLFGRMMDLGPVEAAARETGAVVIEDAAQAIGAWDTKERRAGSVGAMGCFSLYPTKNLGAAGDAGVIVTDDDDLATHLRDLRSHGARTRYWHDEIGINSRLDTLQAAILRAKLPHLDHWTAARQDNARAYDEAFVAAGAAPAGTPAGASALPLRTPHPVAAPARHVQHQYVVRVPEAQRDLLREHLGKAGIATGVYYPAGLHEQPAFGGADANAPLPATEAAARESLALPVFPELGRERRQRVIDEVLAYFAAG